MSNPTTPFSWQMPTATDLVTDLPADFEVFGQAVATSMQDLLGGASGYVLSKASATDMDFTWIPNDVGDITAVTAGTGISGGGTSGAVTVTNSMATTITTKGDLVPGTGSGTFARLAVGNNGQSLFADSAEATGLKYNTPVASLVNPVINGGMDNWQRSTSISVTASTTPYTADRWQVTNGASQALTVSRQATGDTTNLPNIQYCARVQRNSGQTGTGAIAFVQSFETTNSIPFAGKAVTLSFYARKGADYSASPSTIGIDFISGTGTDQNRATAGYTGNANVFSSAATLTTSWQRFVFTGTVAATATELATYFIFNPTGTAGTNDYFELTGVQIDLGTWTATTVPTFRRTGGTFAGELAACQRYYYRLTPGAVSQPLSFGNAYAATVARVSLMFPVEMRIAPTALEQNGTANNYAVAQAGIGAFTCNAVPKFNSASTRFCTLNGIVASGLTTFVPSVVQTDATNGATAYLGWSAEL